MARQKILIVEDDQHISQLVKYNLEKAGFDCATAETGEEAIERLKKGSFDLMILDIMLPQMDGFEVCKRIKQETRCAAMPIMMLTAKGEEVDRIVGFELGADDYMVKPFSPRELLLRVKAILRRGETREAAAEVLKVGHLSIDIPCHKVLVNQKEIHLTAKEYKLLLVLVQRKGRLQSRERLLEDVWDVTADVTTRTVDTHVKRLRQKLGREGRLIETVRGMGYRFYDEE